jgi:hypothetical protein
MNFKPDSENKCINKYCNDFNEHLVNIIRKHFKYKSKRVKSQILEKWITKDILNLMKMRDRAKSLMKKNRNKLNSKVETSLTADQLNTYFAREPKNLIQKKYLNCISNENETNFDLDLETPKFSISLMTEESILRKINKLHFNKSTGSDGIPTRFIKTFKHPILPFILHIFNTSITDGYVPQAWKIARVSAIHKSGSKDEECNYRPISTLPVFGKILAKHIQISISEHLNNYGLISQSQF